MLRAVRHAVVRPHQGLIEVETDVASAVGSGLSNEVVAVTHQQLACIVWFGSALVIRLQWTSSSSEASRRIMPAHQYNFHTRTKSPEAGLPVD